MKKFIARVRPTIRKVINAISWFINWLMEDSKDMNFQEFCSTWKDCSHLPIGLSLTRVRSVMLSDRVTLKSSKKKQSKTTSTKKKH